MWLIIYIITSYFCTVQEKEKLRGHDPDKDDEEGGFGEYTKT